MNFKIRTLREKLKSLNLEGMIVSNPVNIKYLTNIDSEGILLLTRKENIFLTKPEKEFKRIAKNILNENLDIQAIWDYNNIMRLRRQHVFN